MYLRSILFYLIIMFTLFDCIAEFTVLKGPVYKEFNIIQGGVVNDYIWFIRNNQIVKLHVPSRKCEYMDLKNLDVVTPIENNSSFFVLIDSSHVAYFDGDGTLFVNDRSKWSQPFELTFRGMLPTGSGEVWFFSEDQVGLYTSSSLTVNSWDSIGMDYDSHLVLDKSDNVFAYSTYKIAQYKSKKWNIIYNDKKKEISITSALHLPNGDLVFYGSEHMYRLVNGALTRLSDTTKTRETDRITADNTGRVWTGVGCPVEMAHGDTLINAENASLFGWKNWPQGNGSLMIDISGSRIYFCMANGVYCYAGDKNLFWEWIPFNSLDHKNSTVFADKLFPLSDSSMCIVGRSSPEATECELKIFKNGDFQLLPSIELDSNSIVDDVDGSLFVVSGSGMYQFQNSVWIKKNPVTLSHPEKIIHITRDNMKRVVILKGRIDMQSSNVILKQRDLAWEIYNKSNSNIEEIIWDKKTKILQTKDGDYWIFTKNSGVARSTNLYEWNIVTPSSGNLPTRYISDAILSSDGLLVIAGYNSIDVLTTFYQYNGTQWISLGKIPSRDTSGTLFEDNNKKFYYPANNRLYCFGTMNPHVVLDSIAVYDMKIDAHGQFWICSDKGVVLMDSLNKTSAKIKSNTKSTCRLIVKSIFNSKANINYSVNVTEEVSLAVYTLQGKLITTLKSGLIKKGEYNINWSKKGAKGMYIVRFSTPTFVQSSLLKIY